jgi:hypothetical protein
MSELYDEMLAAGLVVDNHESDLYVLDTPEARAIIARYQVYTYSFFRSRIDGRALIDIPFYYAPFWAKRMRKKS